MMRFFCRCYFFNCFPPEADAGQVRKPAFAGARGEARAVQGVGGL